MHPPILLVHRGPEGTAIKSELQTAQFTVEHVPFMSDARRILERDTYAVLLLQFDPNLMDHIKLNLSAARANRDNIAMRIVLMLPEGKEYRVNSPTWDLIARNLRPDACFYPHVYHADHPHESIPPWVKQFIMLGPVGAKESIYRTNKHIVKDKAGVEARYEYLHVPLRER